jgi:protein-S-isoprenylcysteine O-methyltransferase Ste14
VPDVESASATHLVNGFSTITLQMPDTSFPIVTTCPREAAAIKPEQMSKISGPAYASSTDRLLRTLFSGRRRFQIAWLLFAVLVVTCDRYPSALGLAVCFAGATLRFLASGFVRKEVVLAVGGPYAYTRNPLYLGTLLMVLGAAASVSSLAVTSAMAVATYFNYLYVIRAEERALQGRFDVPYLRYCALVPRLLPRLLPPAQTLLRQINPDPQGYSFSLALARRNRAFEAYLSFAGMAGGLFMTAWCRTFFAG